MPKVPAREQLVLFEGDTAADVHVCRFCGGTSPNRYLHDTNHGEMWGRGYCVSQWLTISHIAAARKRGDAAWLEECLRRAVQLGLTAADYGAAVGPGTH